MSAIRYCLTSTRNKLFFLPTASCQIKTFRWCTSSSLLYKPHVPSVKSFLYIQSGPSLRPYFLRSVSSNGGSTDAGSSSLNQSQALSPSKWKRLWKPFLLMQLTLGLGFLAIAFKQFRRKNTHPSQSPELIAKDWEVLYYRIIPFRAMSRAWGWLTSCELPRWARQPIIGLYAKAFQCNLNEAVEDNVENYPSLSEFFRRKLKSGVRPIDESSCVVSPSDGTVLHFGRVTSGMVEQVKGVSYSLSEFLGPAYWQNGPVAISSHHAPGYEKSVLLKEDTDLFHCVIYLAPGDYHCFHSPVEWTVNFRRHFPGELFSVNPSIAKWVAGLFSLNERAVYAGKWRHGFFSMTPVGATNVGSIRVYADQDLRTNCSKRNLPLPYYDRYFSDSPSSSSSADGCVHLKKGEIFGEFNLGSTIVLIFEAPKDFKFNIRAGEKIRMGQGLNLCATDSSN